MTEPARITAKSTRRLRRSISSHQNSDGLQRALQAVGDDLVAIEPPAMVLLSRVEVKPSVVAEDSP